jgi:hypothetical protein
MRKENRVRKYVYLVKSKVNGELFVMIGNLKETNVGSGKYLYKLIKGKYTRETPYGTRSNVSTDKYNAKQYSVVHQTEILVYNYNSCGYGGEIETKRNLVEAFQRNWNMHSNGWAREFGCIEKCIKAWFI